jgi:SagB-type dehydrogenase family enzyme
MHVWISAADDGQRGALLDRAFGPLAVNAPAFAVAVTELLVRPSGAAVREIVAAAEEAEAQGAGLAAAVLDGAFRRLAGWSCLRFASAAQDEAVLTLWPMTEIDPKLLLEVANGGTRGTAPYRLSRFAVLRREGESFILERPLSGFRAMLSTRTKSGAALIASLVNGSMPDDLACAGVPAEQCDLIFSMLALAGIIGSLDEKRLLPEDNDPVLRQWEPEDLAFHSRSRLGYTSDPIGATFRFKDTDFATPAIRAEPPNLGRVPLQTPNLSIIAANDFTLTQAIEARTSRRPRVRRALTLAELGAFLYRTARIRSHQETAGGSFTSRPYPSGGASYESEIYITAQNVSGLRQGFYFYAAQTHELLLLRDWDADCASIAQDALRAMAMLSAPDAVLTFGSRFQRVQWKYSGISYATQLKNTGAAYMAFYLVATAMGLSPCGLGLGNAATFARLTGRDPHKEGSIGEFALSGPGDA